MKTNLGVWPTEYFCIYENGVLSDPEHENILNGYDIVYLSAMDCDREYLSYYNTTQNLTTTLQLPRQ